VVQQKTRVTEVTRLPAPELQHFRAFPTAVGVTRAPGWRLPRLPRPREGDPVTRRHTSRLREEAGSARAVAAVAEVTPQNVSPAVEARRVTRTATRTWAISARAAGPGEITPPAGTVFGGRRYAQRNFGVVPAATAGRVSPHDRAPAPARADHTAVPEPAADAFPRARATAGDRRYRLSPRCAPERFEPITIG
jgi:hypothetical protein